MLLLAALEGPAGGGLEVGLGVCLPPLPTGCQSPPPLVGSRLNL